MQAIIPRIVKALLEEFFLSVLEFLSETASIVVSFIYRYYSCNIELNF